MFLSTPAKIFHAACLLPIVFAGCSFWRSNEPSTVTFASEPKSEYPFTVREPEVFQAEIVVRTGEIERRTLIARSGNLRRIDFEPATDNHRAVLITDKEYVLSFKRKTVEERVTSSNVTAAYEPLTAPILNLRDYAAFDEISRDGSVIQYSARVNESANSEVLIFYDEAIGMAVRQEFYRIEGAERALQYSVELRNFRTDVEASTFDVPPGFKKITRPAGQ